MSDFEGVRLGATDGAARYDLAVDGVFLEIGLEPNSAPLSELLELNEHGEVPVGRDQSTCGPQIFNPFDCGCIATTKYRVEATLNRVNCGFYVRSFTYFSLCKYCILYAAIYIQQMAIPHKMWVAGVAS